MEQATFSLAGEGGFVGYHDPNESWNGFACPFFPLSEVERIAILVDRMNSTDERCDVIVRGDVVVIREESYTDMVTEEQVGTITVDGQTLYGVGAYAWCWSEVEEVCGHCDETECDCVSFGWGRNIDKEVR